MKKLVSLIAFSALTMTAALSYAGSGAATGINGSMHDINSLSAYTQDQADRTCAFCHTPHNAQSDATLLNPLWNHKPSNIALDPYTWKAPANTGIAFAGDPLIGPSRLCEACHDGITAPDAHGAAMGFAGSGPMTASYSDALGNLAKRYINDLAVTHPIGFLYQNAYAARGASELVDASTSSFYVAGVPYGAAAAGFDTTVRPIPGATTGKALKEVLYGGGDDGTGYVTCASCHDVHNTKNAKPAAGHSYNYFVWGQEEGSAICLSCHIK